MRGMTRIAVPVAGVLAVLMAVGCAKQAAQAPQAGRPAVSKPAAKPRQAPAAPQTLGEALKGRKPINSYEFTMTSPEGNIVTQLVKLADGKPVRMKMTHGDEWVLVDLSEKVLYAYSPQQKAAMKMAIEGDKTPEGEPIHVPTPDDYDASASIVGSDTIDGSECWVVASTVKGAQEIGKVWVDKQYGLVRQVKLGSEVMKFTYSRINQVPDSEFELPQGVKVMDMGGMMDQLREKFPEAAR